LVREIGRGRDVEECSLEMTEVSMGGGRWWFSPDSPKPDSPKPDSPKR